MIGGEIIMPMEPMTDCETNFIKETIMKIDKLQKEVVTVGGTRCISCDQSLFNSANNTIPVTLYTHCGTEFTGKTDLAGTTTTFFRIESIRAGRFVTVRLLTTDTTEPETPTLVASFRTMVIDLNEVKAIQCFEPITVEVCSSSLTPNS